MKELLICLLAIGCILLLYDDHSQRAALSATGDLQQQLADLTRERDHLKNQLAQPNHGLSPSSKSSWFEQQQLEKSALDVPVGKNPNPSHY